MKGSEVVYLLTRLRKVYPHIDGGQSWIDALEHQDYQPACAAVRGLVTFPRKALSPPELMDAIEEEAIRLMDAAEAQRELEIDRDPARRGPVSSSETARAELARARAILAGIEPLPALELHDNTRTPNQLDFEPESAFIVEGSGTVDGATTTAPEPEPASST